MSELGDILRLPVLEAAPRLLGWRLRSEVGGYITTVELTEVEAYDGADDPASHAFGGRTDRNASMFDEAGTLYVYRSYGIHWCANVVVGPRGVPSAVLLRGGSPIEGVEVMARRRRRGDHLADGPGKLCQALGVTGEMDGSRIGGALRLLPPQRTVAYDTTPRIGITKAADRPWRFVVTAPG